MDRDLGRWLLRCCSPVVSLRIGPWCRFDGEASFGIAFEFVMANYSLRKCRGNWRTSLRELEEPINDHCEIF